MQTKEKPKPKSKAKAPEVGVMFRAPQEIRACVRSISAWAEMNDVRIEGRIPSDKDIWAWIAAGLYKSGESAWKDVLENGADAYRKLVKAN